MNTLTSKTILYDKECPMCSWYTGKFIDLGVLPESGRLPFDEITADHFLRIDPDRARHEIALIDTGGGETVYGLDSLLIIFKQLFPPMERVFNSKALKTALYPLYQIITYNRRLISGNTSEYTAGSCIPDFHLFWRLTYILLALGIGFATLFAVGNQVNSDLVLLSGLSWVGVMLIGGIFQRRPMDYIGHLSTLLLIQSLILLPGLVAGKVMGIPLTGLLFALYLLGASFTWWQHELRIRVLKESQFWTLIWATLVVGMGLYFWMLIL